jgi:acyl-CoA synthetase (AMP-forming)/AMP-acid ligase II
VGGTIPDLLAGADPARPAIAGLEGRTATYRGLRDTVERLRGQLAGLGLGAGARVALVLPNGPEMAAAFLAVASSCTAAPLNPAYRREEFAFYLADLGARALITAADDASAAPAALPAGALHLRLEVGRKGWSLTRNGSPLPSSTPSDPVPADVALVLHTSGTTARPKIVPLTHANLTASAANVAASLALTPADRCLNVMPLFHIHGLVGALLASLHSGGSIACAPGFDAFRFFGWLEAARPTWYTAVPTMHQMVLSRRAAPAEAARRARLRFIRSSSAPLPPVVMEGLEAAFGTPVIEAYGMTEAAHQMTSSPLPPAPRKAGSVGLGTGVEVDVIDDAGRRLAAGEQGEVVVRGPNVTSGYEGNAEANAAAFIDGWFRTGDQGYRDGDGYLYLTGRLKEIINRGGEKVSPREVDEALLRHPAVAQAVAFALPHPRLGEEVAAAVVLAEGATASERDLREHLARHLADFKVPRRFVFLQELPKGPTGKPVRIGLAERLGLV